MPCFAERALRCVPMPSRLVWSPTRSKPAAPVHESLDRGGLGVRDRLLGRLDDQHVVTRQQFIVIGASRVGVDRIPLPQPFGERREAIGREITVPLGVEVPSRRLPDAAESVVDQDSARPSPCRVERTQASSPTTVPRADNRRAGCAKRRKPRRLNRGGGRGSVRRSAAEHDPRPDRPRRERDT